MELFISKPNMSELYKEVVFYRVCDLVPLRLKQAVRQKMEQARATESFLQHLCYN